MKKTIRFLALVLMLVMCALGFSSCRGEVESTVGSSFTMLISGEEDQVMTVTDFMLEWRDADIENADDYYHGELNGSYSFGKYVYTLYLSGYVDAKYAGKKLEFHYGLEEPYGVSDGTPSVTVVIGADGSFSYEEDILHTNAEYIYVTPYSVWIR